MNTYYIEAATYLTGAVSILVALLAALGILLVFVNTVCTRLFINSLRLFNITQLRYWLIRMEREGLTIAGTEYRAMVKAKKPQTLGDYQDIEQETVFKESK